jgi:hypothetical protein
LYTRPLWQDAAAAAANAVRAADLSSDGRVLTSYAPRPCGSGCATLPSTANQANYRTEIFEFDGLAHVNTAKTLRCLAASDAVSGCTGTTELVSVTRQGTNAGAKVDNYNDPLAASEVPWRQSADQYFASMRDSGGTNADLYREELLYGNRHEPTATSGPGWNRYASYGPTVTGSDWVKAKGYWRLDETSGIVATDNSGNGWNGTYKNGPSLGGAGALLNAVTNKAPAFDGVNQYVEFTAGQKISGSYTVEAWARPADTTTAAMAIAGARTGGCDSADPAEAQAWRYAYDALGRQTKQIPPVNVTAVALNTAETVYETGGRIDKVCSYPAGGSCASTTNTHWTDLVDTPGSGRLEADRPMVGIC